MALVLILIAMALCNTFQSTYGLYEKWNNKNELNPYYMNVTGQTPPPKLCFDSMCNGKADGNYEVRYPNGEYDPNYFLQCSGGQANCQPCWPQSLEFSQTCNQCLYSRDDECLTTEAWKPASTYDCPDICGRMGPEGRMNIRDPQQPRQYVACWNGMTVGCVKCPGNLLFNETFNACLYDGKYWTQSLN
ncbi:uncharacterized protein [Clytia hemisphaerica]|uniref:Chitin-binding type-2 domain-containing protein n=1 Tax=Clytia hemisphaerica TaxID=252671 RepID=A0A7M5VBC0_9CNID